MEIPKKFKCLCVFCGIHAIAMLHPQEKESPSWATRSRFSEKRIKALAAPTPPLGKTYTQVYYKDKTVPGLQVCVTSAGRKSYYLVKRIDGRPTRVLLGTADQLSVETACKAADHQGGRSGQWKKSPARA